MKESIIFLFLLITLSGFCDKFVWNSKAPYPSFPRHRCAAFSIGNKGYMGIGHINSGSISQGYDDWWEFDPATNSWSQKANYPKNRYGTATFVIGNKGYMGTGCKQNDPDQQDFFEYDPITNLWTQKADFPIASSGNIGFTINGEGYIGLSSNAGLYKYDVSADTWTAVSTTIPGTDYSASFVINNKLFVVPAFSNSLYMFDPVTGSTTTLAPFIGQIRYGSCSFSVRGQGYVGLGDYSGSFKDFYVYDSATNSWDTIPKAFPGVRRFYVPSFVIGDNAYFGTGTNGTNLGDMWAYEWKVAVGIQEQFQDKDFLIYSDPVNELVNFSIPKAAVNQKLILTIFSLDGKVLHDEQINEANFSCRSSEIKKGMYLACIRNQENSIFITKKLIIN